MITNKECGNQVFTFRRHFSRTTVSLGDHNVKVYNDAKSTFRKIRRIIRFPTYDNNLIDGDLALLHLTDPVELTRRYLKLRVFPLSSDSSIFQPTLTPPVSRPRPRRLTGLPRL